MCDSLELLLQSCSIPKKIALSIASVILGVSSITTAWAIFVCTKSSTASHSIGEGEYPLSSLESGSVVVLAVSMSWRGHGRECEWVWGLKAIHESLEVYGL